MAQSKEARNICRDIRMLFICKNKELFTPPSLNIPAIRTFYKYFYYLSTKKEKRTLKKIFISQIFTIRVIIFLYFRPKLNTVPLKYTESQNTTCEYLHRYTMQLSLIIDNINYLYFHSPSNKMKKKR